MKYMKMLGLLAVAAAALMAFAATASATTVTSPKNTTYTGTIKAESEGSTTLHGPADVTCGKSTVEGSVEQHGTGVTVKGASKISFSECGKETHVTVEKGGSLELHSNGDLTSSGAAVKVEFTALGLTCVYTTSGTKVGTFTGSDTTNATLDIDSAAIPRTEGSFFCGSSGEWTGSYKVTTPSTLSVD
jgi:hypothetical protein